MPLARVVFCSMLDVEALAQWAEGKTAAEFRARVGPFTLIHEPPAPVYAQIALRLGGGRTVTMAHRSRLSQKIMTMVTAFRHQRVIELARLSEGRELSIGRGD